MVIYNKYEIIIKNIYSFMKPCLLDDNLIEITFCNNHIKMNPVPNNGKLDDKYYLVQVGNDYGVYHKDYGFSNILDIIWKFIFA